MKSRYTKEDFKRGVIKNYSDKISVNDKILMIIKAYLVENEIENKENH